MKSALRQLVLVLCTAAYAVHAQDSDEHFPPARKCREGEDPRGGQCVLAPLTIQGCLDTTPYVGSYGCKRLLFHADCLETWDDAQLVCEARGGRLWEPADQAEYDAVFASIGYTGPNNPAWLSLPGGSWELYFHWWIGLRNEDADGTGSGATARYASSGLVVPWKTLNEAQASQHCVDIYSDKDKWGDHPCDLELKFVCEVEDDCCPCKYEGSFYERGSHIDYLEHCCTEIYCDDLGFVSTSTLNNADGSYLHGCCVYQGQLVRPGDYTWDWRYICRDGTLYPVIHIPEPHDPKRDKF